MCFRNGASVRAARRDHSLSFYLVVPAALMGFVGLMLSGCSGGSSHGSSGTTSTPTPSSSASPSATAPAAVAVTAEIAWPARSRAATPVNGTASAVSAVITLTGTGVTPASGISVVANRPAGVDTAAVTTTYTLSGTAIPGQLYGLKVNFYTGANATGTVIATAAQAETEVQTDGTLAATVITTATKVATVTISDVSAVGSTTGLGKKIGVGQTVDVLYSLYDSAGDLLAAPPADYGSGFAAITSGSTSYLAAGTLGDEIVGLAPSVGASFAVSVDGVTSSPLTVKVVSTETLSVTPSAVTVSPGIPQTFTATINPAAADTSPSVTWTLTNSSGTALTSGGANGTFTSTGMTFTYTPPATYPPALGTLKLIATSVYDPNATVSVPVTVGSLVSVSISPSTATPISLKQTEQFTAAVTDDPSAQPEVTWSATGGTFSSTTTASGTAVTYTAPATTGTYTITATSVFDSKNLSGMAVATVTVVVDSTVAVTIATSPVQNPLPNPLALSVDQTQVFTAAVLNDPTSAGVNWSIQNASGTTLTNSGTSSTIVTSGGTIIVNGLTATYTAPTSVSSASGIDSYYIVATSVLDSSKFARIPITVGAGSITGTVN